MAVAAAAAVELDLQKCLGLYMDILNHALSPLYKGAGGAQFDSEDDTKFDLIEQTLDLLMKKDGKVNHTEEVASGALAAALFTEMLLKKLIAFGERKCPSPLKCLDYDVYVTERGQKQNPDALIEDALSLMRKSKETAVNWTRNMTNYRPFSKGVKHLFSRSVAHAVEDGILLEEEQKGLFYSYKIHPAAPEPDKCLVTLIRNFGLNNEPPKSRRDLFLLALWYIFDVHRRNACIKTFPRKKVFPDEEEVKTAQQNMDNFFSPFKMA